MEAARTADAEAQAWERRLYEAMISQDTDRLDPLLDADLTYIHSPGFAETKTEYLAGVRTGLYEYAAVDTVSARTFAGGDYVTRTGLAEMLVGEGGKEPVRLKLLYTLVWRVSGDVWRLVLRQATRVPS